MSEHKEIPQIGTFCWNELASKDASVSGKFYSELFGWKAIEVPMEGMNYTIFKAEDKDVGGMCQMNAEWGETPSHWMAYVAVADVDALAARVEELGGKVCVPPTDIPTVGRFSVIQDPTGATLSMIKLFAG